MANTATATHTKSGGRKRAVLIATIATTVIGLAAAVGVWALQHDSSAAAAGSSTPASATDARGQNPVFAGKFIGAVNIWGGKSGSDPLMSLDLKPGPQAKFFEDLGFTYNPKFSAQGNEPNPRPVNSGPLTQYDAMSGVNTGYVLAVRSDAAAGGGSLVSLPPAVTGSNATVIVLDDPQAVTAMTEWSSSSEQILLDKLLPILRKNVK